MLKTSIKATLAAGTLLLGNALAQTPAAPTQPTTPAKPKSTTTPAKKTTTATKPAAAPLALKTKKEKFSYALGMNVGQNLGQTLKKQDIAIDPAILARGLRDAIAGSKTALTEQEAKDILTEVQNELHAKQQAKNQEEAATNKKSGEVFAAANKAKDGVVVLPSGLQYKILTAGTGPKPTTADTVVCNYSGTLTDGKEFDSSYKRGEPATFPVSGVIKGWTEALQLMPVGSKWQLVIPSDLAYGDAGRPGIPPGATLVFEVELMSIKEKTAEKAPDKAAPEEKK